MGSQWFDKRDVDKDDNDFFLMFNGSRKDHPFRICSPPIGTLWFMAINTALPENEDIPLFGNEKLVNEQTTYLVSAKSVVVLISRKI